MCGLSEFGAPFVSFMWDPGGSCWVLVSLAHFQYLLYGVLVSLDHSRYLSCRVLVSLDHPRYLSCESLVRVSHFLVNNPFMQGLGEFGSPSVSFMRGLGEFR